MRIVLTFHRCHPYDTCQGFISEEGLIVVPWCEAALDRAQFHYVRDLQREATEHFYKNFRIIQLPDIDGGHCFFQVDFPLWYCKPSINDAKDAIDRAIRMRDWFTVR